MKTELLILDGRHLLYRTADVFKDLCIETPEGEMSTGAIYGFLNTALHIHNRWGGVVVVCWEGTHNFRFDLLPTHKAKGEPDDAKRVFLEDMDRQEVLLKEALSKIGVNQYSGERCEADDVIGTIVRSIAPSRETIIYTGDSDLRQLVNGNTLVVAPGRRGIDHMYDVAAVVEKHGVQPHQIPDLKALAGDHSDNIPGIHGIGPVMASKLITAYGTIEMIAHAAKRQDEGWPISKRYMQTIATHPNVLKLYKTLATIKVDVKLIHIPTTKDKTSVIELMRKYKFRTLLDPVDLNHLMRLGGESHD